MHSSTTAYKHFVSEISKDLAKIHEESNNIRTCNRDLYHLQDDIGRYISNFDDIKLVGNATEIEKKLNHLLPNHNNLRLDLLNLIDVFIEITGSSKLRFFFGTITENMCRKFHTDLNDLRLLCTYSGPGTLWLKEDNINRKALNSFDEIDDIVIDDKKIQQASTGAIVIMKGALYPGKNTLAAVHRSPTIETSGERRLLLRMDTNDLNIFS